MPRQARLDFKGAIHYASVRGRPGREIFIASEDLAKSHRAPHEGHLRVVKFQGLVAEACEECDVQLHAYCIEPNAATLVVRTPGAPLRAFMRRLCGSYAQHMRHTGFAEKGSVFRTRYDSKIVAPEYLPHAVRRVHSRPMVGGLCRRRVDYPFSSERAYIGEPTSLRIDTAEVKVALQYRGHVGLRGYRDFMDQDETPFVARLLTKGSPLDARIIGDKVFVQRARYLATHPPKPPTPEQLIETVSRLLNKTPADISSATHAGVLGRALVAWYGQRMGAATLTEMGHWFSVTGASLGQAIRHHRRLRPELFNDPLAAELEPMTEEHYRYC